MKQPMPRKYEIAILVFMLLLVAGAVWFGYSQGKQSTNQHVVNPQLLELQDSLELRAAIKLEFEAIYSDSMALHQERYAAALADTNGTSEITKRHDEITTANWNLPNDSAARLYRARLDKETEYRKRFVYVLD
ncbi:MAG: hypothetical protein ACPG5W_02705 [Flavobacteriales bacterium]